MTPHFEVVLVRRGVFLRTSHSVRTVADRTVASFWSADEVFRIRHMSPESDRCTILRFSSAALSELLETISPSLNDRSVLRFPRPHMGVSSEQYLHHLRLLERVEMEAEPIEVEERAIELATALLTAATSDTHGTFPRARARVTAIEFSARVRELVANRFLEPLSLAQIAREVCCSPFHLSRMMVAAEGIRIHELIVQLRLREALHRLLDTREAICVIAIQTGFSSHSHFTAAFRREFGMTPRLARDRGIR